jgi:regulator of protease activity HflC (stomatin/prohibitin superfamily)
VHRTKTVALLALLAGGCAYIDVPPGHVAVNWTLDGMEPKVYREGEWHIGYYDKATVLDSRSQDREERLYVLTANGERIVLDASVAYHIVPQEAVQLMQDEGVHYYSKLLGPVLRSQARRVIGHYLPEEIYSTKREAIEREIREGVAKAIEGRHLVLEAVLIRDITLPEDIQRAINDKLRAEQESLKQKYLMDTARQVADREKLQADAEAQRSHIGARSDAENVRIRAEADAEATHLRAQAAADETRIDARAQADAKEIAARATEDSQRLIQKTLTPKVLEYDRVEATSDLARADNSKVIVLGAGSKTTPLMQLP